MGAHGHPKREASLQRLRPGLKGNNMYKRIVIYHEEMGVFLGECFGLCFWSKLDPVGQSAAVVFGSVAEATHIVGLIQDPPKSLQFLEVETKDPVYVSIPEIEAAGLPGWDPNMIPDVDEDQLEEVEV